MSQQARAGTVKWRIILLTCRPPDTDFRLPLAKALQSLGHDVSYVYLKRKPVVVEMSQPQIRREFSFPGFIRQARQHSRKDLPLVVFNSTNLVFPFFSRILRVLLGGLWCFDMHDDLLYGTTGRKRRKAALAQRILVAGSDLMVHAAPTLAEKFPLSHHLGNASDLTFIDRPSKDFSRILILASIDERMDFGFLAACASANPDLIFDIYGQISGNDPVVRSHVETLLRNNANISWHGPYRNAGLVPLLSRYAVTLAPYVATSPLTRYIDPLRFYHCLNSGQEVISTAIPGAIDFSNLVHVIGRPEELGPLIESLREGRAAKNHDTSGRFNWNEKARALEEIILGHMRK